MRQIVEIETRLKWGQLIGFVFDRVKPVYPRKHSFCVCVCVGGVL